MKRREFLSHAGSAAMVTALSPGLLSSCAAREKSPAAPAFNYTSAYGVQTLRIWSPLVREAVHLFALADSHLYEADERNAPYHPYSARMEGAYNEVAHYRTHRPTTPAAAFRECMEVAAASPADAIVHLGDLVSYPSEHSIEYASALIRKSGKPFYYVSGNHDWNYEGLDDDDKTAARERWMPRLKPFYNEGVNPLMYSVVIKGVKLIFIDDSADTVSPEQIDFFCREVRWDGPSLLMMHIGQAFPGHDSFYLGYPRFRPVYTPGRGLAMLSKADGSHEPQIERFFAEVLRASRETGLLATVVGHEHDIRSEEVENHRQFVLPFGGNGSYTDILLLPLSESVPYTGYEK